MRMSNDRLPKKFITSWVANPKPKGRPQFTYGHGLEKDLKSKFLDLDTWTTAVQDREKRRTIIKKSF